MSPKVIEALTILQEECAEVIQVVSKIKRFGLHQSFGDQDPNSIRLEKEIGDVLAIIDYLVQAEVLDQVGLIQGKINKVNKLKDFSNLYV